MAWVVLWETWTMMRAGPGGPGPRDFRKPKNAGRTISTLLGYVGKSKWLLG